jgi:hypothetical protein
MLQSAVEPFMRTHPLGQLLFLGLPLLLTLTPQVRGTLITNGGFENLTTTVPANGVCTNDPSVLPFNSCVATGWTGTYQIGNGPGNGNGGSFHIPQPDPNGNNALILQTSFNVVSSNATQSLSIPTDGVYALSFFVANRSAGATSPGPQTVSVSWDGSVVPSGVYTTIPTAWTKETLDIDTTSGSHTLTFSGLATPVGFDASAFIDDVSLAPKPSATPEPSSGLLIGLGCILLAGTTRKRLKKLDRLH